MHRLQKGLRGPGTRDRMRAGTPFPRASKVSDNHMGRLRYGRIKSLRI